MTTDKTYIGTRTSSLETSRKFDPVSKVVVYTSEDIAFTAGTEGGQVLEVNCTNGTQAIADAILKQAQSRPYQPLTATEALLDPSVELGDAMTVAGNYSVIASLDLSGDALGLADVSAPGKREPESELGGFRGYLEQKMNRSAAEFSSSLTKTAEEIRAEVKNTADGLSSLISQTADQIRTEVKNTTDGLSSQITQTAGEINQRITDEVNGLSSQITQTAGEINQRITDEVNGLSSQITQTAGEIRTEVNNSIEGLSTTFTQTFESFETRVENAEGAISSVTQTADKINWVVKSGTSSTDFTLTDRAVSLVTGTISLTAKNNADGTQTTLTLTGGGATLSSAEIHLTGLVTFSSLKAGGTTEIDGSRITTGTISANRLDLSAYSTTSQMNSSINSAIQGLRNGLKLSVTNSSTGTSSTLTLTDSGTTLSSATITFNGMVTFSDLDGSKGKTIIDGSVIKAGTITADSISGNFLTATDVGSSGKTVISGSRITTGLIQDQRSGSKSSWNLDTGAFTTYSMTANSISADGSFTCTSGNLKMTLQDAKLTGYIGSNEYSHVDVGFTIEDYDTGTQYRAMELYGKEGIYITTPRIAVTDNENKVGYYAYTGMALGQVVTTIKSGTYEVQNAALRFINGICVGVSADQPWFGGENLNSGANTGHVG